MKIEEVKTRFSAPDVDFRPEVITHLDNYFASLIEEKKLLNATYVLSRYGKTFAHKAMGKQTYKRDSALCQPDTIRNVASVCKTFTAVAIMQLIETGKIGLHQSVSEIIPQFNTAMHRKITIFHLLTLTSGLPADPEYYLEPYADHSYWAQFEEEDWIERLLTGPLQNPIGTVWAYSSGGYAVLGKIISEVSRMSYQAYIRNNIITPMGLTQTWVGDIPEELIGRMSFASQDEEDEWRSYYNAGSVTPLIASGGIETTVIDLHSFTQMLLNGGSFNGTRILSRKSVEMMTRNQLTGQPAFFEGAEYENYQCGFGVRLTHDSILSPGTFSFGGGGYTYTLCDPVEKFVATWFVPTLVDYSWEAHVGVESILASGLL